MAGIEAVGVAGEHLLALTIYLTGTSRLLEQPLAVIVQGPSASGKSYVIERVARRFPAEAVLIATDITPNALYDLSPGELEHRFVVAGERSRHHNDETTKALREMISAGQLLKVLTVSDPEGPRAVTVQQQGPIAYAESTTAPDVFEEDANRCLVLQPDERPEQTRRILAASGRHLAGQSSAELREQLRRSFTHCIGCWKLYQSSSPSRKTSPVCFPANRWRSGGRSRLWLGGMGEKRLNRGRNSTGKVSVVSV